MQTTPLDNGLNDAQIRQLFTEIDRKHVNGFGAYLSRDVSFRFGNAEAVEGHDAVCGAVEAFFASIHDLSHRLERIIRDGNHIVCHGQVTYTRHDGSRLSVPFANLFETDRGLIRDYRIFIDASALYAET